MKGPSAQLIADRDRVSDVVSRLEENSIIVDQAIAELAREQPPPRTATATGRAGEAARNAGVKRLARRAVTWTARRGSTRRLLLTLLGDPRTRSWMLHRLSNWNSARASFDIEEARSVTAIETFEDCDWLFSSNPLNHGLARLELEEGAYLFRLVRSLGQPVVGEIGRFRGGTTFLLVAAGARRIVSVDNDLTCQAQYAPELADALSRFGLRDRVEIVVADSRTYPLEPASFDLVFVDGDHSYDGVRADFEHWWPAVAPGGHMVFHDARFPEWDSRLAATKGVVRLVAELERGQMGEQRPAPGSLAHFVKLSDAVPEALLVRAGEVRRPA